MRNANTIAANAPDVGAPYTENIWYVLGFVPDKEATPRQKYVRKMAEISEIDGQTQKKLLHVYLSRRTHEN